MSQELQYLRAELNQSLRFLDEHPQKTVNIILLIWGGASVIFGMKLFEFKDITLYFFFLTIFFLSNYILYFSAQRANDNMKGIAKIAAYIIVFYEKRPSETVKVGFDNNISWEIASIDYRHYKNCNLEIRKNNEYIMLMIFSILVIFVSTIMFFQISELKEIFKIGGLLISGLYFFISLWLLYKICGLLKGFSDTKDKYLKDFVKYSLKTNHYTEKDIEEKLGEEIWDEIKDEIMQTKSPLNPTPQPPPPTTR